MSYDLQFFRLPDGVTIDEINSFLDSPDYEEYIEEMDRLEEEDEDVDPPPLPERFIDTALNEEALRMMIGTAYFRTVIPEGERSEEMALFLDPEEDEPIPDELDEDWDLFFEYSGSPGMIPLSFSYGGDIGGIAGIMASILVELHSDRIVVFDPQMDMVIGGGDSKALLKESAEKSVQYCQDVIKQLMEGD